MITVLHGALEEGRVLSKWLQYYIGWVEQMITVCTPWFWRDYTRNLRIWQKNQTSFLFRVGKSKCPKNVYIIYVGIYVSMTWIYVNFTTNQRSLLFRVGKSKCPKKDFIIYVGIYVSMTWICKWTVGDQNLMSCLLFDIGDLLKHAIKCIENMQNHQRS